MKYIVVDSLTGKSTYAAMRNPGGVYKVLATFANRTTASLACAALNKVDSE